MIKMNKEERKEVRKKIDQLDIKLARTFHQFEFIKRNEMLRLRKLLTQQLTLNNHKGGNN